MAFYTRAGITPAKHFMRFQSEDGASYHEELISSAGFQGPSALLYRIAPPTRVLRVEPGLPLQVKPWTDQFRNHLFYVDRIGASGDPISARRGLVFNEDLTMWIAKPTLPSSGFYRNGYCDELTLIIEGTGKVVTAFGELEYGPLDYINVPRGLTVKWYPNKDPQTWVVVESVGPITIPARFRNSAGQLLSRAPYHERDLRLPVLGEPDSSKGEFEIMVKSGDQMSRYIVDSHPFDVVGWDGALYPFAFNMRSYEPITGMLHQMPDMYQVFETPNAAICNVTPRRMEEHPLRAPAQANHMNVDYDEILYRIKNEAPPAPLPSAEGERHWSPEPPMGTITLNRRSVPHGPKAGYEIRPEPDHLDVFMFMLDTKTPLMPCADAIEADDPSYIQSWL
jgi:homogentisate 1,2-dioxygenase